MNRYGLTEREKAIWPPKKKKIDWIIVGGWTVLMVILGILLVQIFLLPLTVVHADTKPLSDREQEKQYCKAWTRGAQVNGGTADAIYQHCKKYL